MVSQWLLAIGLTLNPLQRLSGTTHAWGGRSELFTVKTRAVELARQIDGRDAGHEPFMASSYSHSWSGDMSLFCGFS